MTTCVPGSHSQAKLFVRAVPNAMEGWIPAPSTIPTFTAHESLSQHHTVTVLGSFAVRQEALFLNCRVHLNDALPLQC